MKHISTIVIGSMNTEIVGFGFPALLKPGQTSHGEKAKIGAGGKSRNIAQMVAALIGQGKVAMLGRTSQDPYGLWRCPVDALLEAGVDCSGIRFVRFDQDNWPGLSLITTDQEGERTISVVEGVNREFCPEDLESADHLFRQAARNDGIFITTLEHPLGTVLFGIEKAKRHGLRVLIDPGGMRAGLDYASVLSKDVFLFKPNEEEAEKITGGKVRDVESAKKVARALLKLGPRHVLLTIGERGAVLASENGLNHIPVPSVNGGTARDATGCGDQVMAALSAQLLKEKSVIDACLTAVRAGTLQYYREGIIPLREPELLAE